MSENVGERQTDRQEESDWQTLSRRRHSEGWEMEGKGGVTENTGVREWCSTVCHWCTSRTWGEDLFSDQSWLSEMFDICSRQPNWFRSNTSQSPLLGVYSGIAAQKAKSVSLGHEHECSANWKMQPCKLCMRLCVAWPLIWAELRFL